MDRDEGERRRWVPGMVKALKFAFFFALAIFVAPELLRWALTGELASIVRGGGESRTLTWADEPGYFLFTAVLRIGEFLVGVGGMIYVLRSDGVPPQAPE